jgi:signal transduction histidine kinase
MTRSLRVWLALGLALVVIAPALAGVGAWAGAGAWQAAHEAGRTRDAQAAVRTADLASAAGRDRLIAKLARLDVEAQVIAGKDPEAIKKSALGGAPMLTTPRLAAIDSAGGKEQLASYRTSVVEADGVVAQLWVPRESAAARWVIALGAGAIALAAALAVVIALLRRWVLRPLARLAADADRIAGGELDVQPVPTRAREVAQVGDALHGMARALDAALGASAAAERDRRFLVTAIAHDLRTPLFTLRGSLEALERGLGDGRYLGLAQDRAAHLDGLVTDLFRFSRLEYAPETVALDEVDVVALARRAVSASQPLAAARGCVVELSDSPAEAVVRGDPEALQRVLTNLLDNAIRHARTRVTLTTRSESGALSVDVADDGPGFREQDLPRVFEPLFRSDRARADADHHSGLGLAIARRLVRAHGGEVRAANDTGGGARVTVELPVAVT